MSIPTFTFGYLKARVAFHLTNSETVPSALDTEIEHALDTALREMVLGVDVPAFRKEGSFSTVANTSVYAVEEDWARMIEPSMRIDVSPFYPIRFVTEQAVDASMASVFTASTVARPTHYSLTHRSEDDGAFVVKLRPVPDAVYPIRYRYYSYPQSFRDEADTTLLDLRFPVEAVQGLIARAALHFTDYLNGDKLRRLEIIAGDGLRALTRTKDPLAGSAFTPRNQTLSGYGAHVHGPFSVDPISPYGGV